MGQRRRGARRATEITLREEREMKKLITGLSAALALAAFTMPAYGQGVSIGAKLGASLADLGGDIEDTDIRTGFAGGAALGIDLGMITGLQLELLYVQKGAEFSDVIDGVPVNVTAKLAYVEVPVLFNVVVPVPNSPIQPRFFGGPAISLELSCDFEAEANGESEEADCEDVEAPTKSVDFGLVFGGGVDFAVGTGAVTVDGRYNLGLTNILDDDSGDEVKNRSFQILVGYMVRVGV
jgi:hypothetical protein